LALGLDLKLSYGRGVLPGLREEPALVQVSNKWALVLSMAGVTKSAGGLRLRPVAAIHNNYRVALDVTVRVKPGN
jgi:hypothetical protein